MNVHDWEFGRYYEEQRGDFRRLRDLASVLDLPRPGLVELLEEALIEGLHWLDSLDRSDSFWAGTNHLPTVHKLVDRTRVMMSEDPSPRVGWYDFAISMVGARSPAADHPIWTLLPVEMIHPEWLIEASWIEMSASGFFKPLASVAARLGCTEAFKEQLLRLSSSREEHVVSWARLELRAVSRAKLAGLPEVD